jgi:hypothetical protein
MFTRYLALPDHPGHGPGLQAILTIAAAALALPAVLVLLSVSRSNAWIAGPAADGSYAVRARAWFEARGLFPAEFDTQASRSFSWTRTQGAFVVPLLDRSRPHQLRLSVRGASPVPGRPSQQLMLAVDGLLAESVVLTGQPQTFVVRIPPSRRSRADVAFRLSHGVVPGAHDPRELGMIVDDVALAPSGEGWIRVPRRAWLAAALAGAILGLIVALGGGPIVWTLSAAVTAAAGSAWLLNLDAAFLGNDYVWRVVRFDLGVAAAALVFAAVARMRNWHIDGVARVAFTAVLIVLALRTAVFLHPSVTKGDGFFQVHRAQLVHAGQYFFTSLTPRPFFEFPYAPGLYVAAMPLWTSFPYETDRLILLRTIALVMDAAAALALFAAVRRFWTPEAAFVSAALYQLVPVGLHTACTANLTNLFGQSLFALGTLLACRTMGRVHHTWWALGLALLLAGAFMSHFSTLSTGVPIVLAVVVGLSLRGDSRRAALWMAAALAVALILSYALYYSHFHAVYAKTLARILEGGGQPQARSMAAPVSIKIERFARALLYDYYGLPLLVGALAGGIALAAQRASDAWTRTLVGWLGVVVAFFALGILTPIEMRAALSAQPVVAALFGLGVGALWTRNAPAKIAAIVLVGAVALRGVIDWLGCLGQVAAG